MAIEVNVEVAGPKPAKLDYPCLVVNSILVVWVATGRHSGMCAVPIDQKTLYVVEGSLNLDFEEGGWSLYHGEITLKNKPE